MTITWLVITVNSYHDNYHNMSKPNQPQDQGIWAEKGGFLGFYGLDDPVKQGSLGNRRGISLLLLLERKAPERVFCNAAG